MKYTRYISFYRSQEHYFITWPCILREELFTRELSNMMMGADGVSPVLNITRRWKSPRRSCARMKPRMVSMRRMMTMSDVHLICITTRRTSFIQVNGTFRWKADTPSVQTLHMSLTMSVGMTDCVDCLGSAETRGGGGTQICSDLVWTGVCRSSLKTLPIFMGHFGRKRYPFLETFLEI